MHLRKRQQPCDRIIGCDVYIQHKSNEGRSSSCAFNTRTHTKIACVHNLLLLSSSVFLSAYMFCERKANNSFILLYITPKWISLLFTNGSKNRAVNNIAFIRIMYTINPKRSLNISKRINAIPCVFVDIN